MKKEERGNDTFLLARNVKNDLPYKVPYPTLHMSFSQLEYYSLKYSALLYSPLSDHFSLLSSSYQCRIHLITNWQNIPTPAYLSQKRERTRMGDTNDLIPFHPSPSLFLLSTLSLHHCPHTYVALWNKTPLL